MICFGCTIPSGLRAGVSAGFVLLVGALFGFLPVHAQDHLCSRSVGGLAGLPTIDGVVHGNVTPTTTNDDPGWGNAAQVNLNAGSGSARTARFYVGHTSDHVYLGVVSENPAPDRYTTLVLGVSPTGSASDDWRIHLKPFEDASSSGTNEDPRVVEYWRNSANWNTAGTGSTPSSGHWLAAAGPNVKWAKHSTAAAWSMEVRIPRDSDPNNGIDFPSGSSTFEMYLNVVSTNSFTSTSTYSEAEYPSGSTLDVPSSGITQIHEATPPPSAWGTVSLGSRSACNGVTIDWNDIGVREGSANTISFSSPSNCSSPGTSPTGPTNTFFAEPTSTSGSATGVTAEFRLANWGIPATDEWAQVPVTSGNNPTTPVSVSPSGPASPMEMEWRLSEEQACTYQARPHQCIQVELDSQQPATRFLRRGATRNMDFVSASTFDRTALIGGQGWGEPLEGGPNHQLMLAVSKMVAPVERSEDGYVPVRPERDVQEEDTVQTIEGSSFLGVGPIPIEQYEGKITEGMTWLGFGYLLRPGRLGIEQEEFQRTEAVGGFGFFAGHAGTVSEWSSSIEGPGIRQAEHGGYMVEIPRGEATQVKVSLEAQEEGNGNGDGGDGDGDAGDGEGGICPGGSEETAGIFLFAAVLAGAVVVARRRRRF